MKGSEVGIESAPALNTNGVKDYKELNNNNNNKKILDTTILVSSVSSVESVDWSTPRKASSETDWIGVGTCRRRRITKDKAVSLKVEFEELGLEHVIPRHRSPKALSEMGKRDPSYATYVILSTQIRSKKFLVQLHTLQSYHTTTYLIFLVQNYPKHLN